jgi:Terminase large subunit, T4likevirus-type, N-terminal
MSAKRQIAYRLDPVSWVREQLEITPMPWQEQFLRAQRGASILALTARQVGKTTTAAWAIAHTMLFYPGSLSVIACPAQRQSGEAVRRVREILLKLGAKFKIENTYTLELQNGSRVLALPGDDETVRGLTVDGWIVADEAARLDADLITALHPMRARCPQARFAMLSTAWKRTDPFWTAWTSENRNWLRLKATADVEGAPFTQQFLEEQRQILGEQGFNQEYLGIPGGGNATPFTWDLYERATGVHAPIVPPGSAFPAPVQPETLTVKRAPNPHALIALPLPFRWRVEPARLRFAR